MIPEYSNINYMPSWLMDIEMQNPMLQLVSHRILPLPPKPEVDKIQDVKHTQIR